MFGRSKARPQDAASVPEPSRAPVAPGPYDADALDLEDGVELRAFAAPRNGDLWTDIYPQIAEDMRRRGGRVEQREGPHGIELVGAVPVDVGNGEMRDQPSRVVGINGPRWMLRATFLGKPAVEPDASGDWDDVLQSVVVRRGAQAMPVGDALPLRLPPNANRVS